MGTHLKSEEILHVYPVFLCIWGLLLRCCEQETAMFDWDGLKCGVLESVRFLHWRPPDLRIFDTDPSLTFSYSRNVCM